MRRSTRNRVFGVVILLVMSMGFQGALPTQQQEIAHAQSIVPLRARMLVRVGAALADSARQSGKFPAGTALADLQISGLKVDVYLTTPADFLNTTLTDSVANGLMMELIQALQPFYAELTAAAGIKPDSLDHRLRVGLFFKDTRVADGRFRTISDFLPAAPAPPAQPAAAPAAPAAAPVTGGGLAGKTVYLSAGHGWTWTWYEPNLPDWFTQRPVWQSLIEDFNNAEVVNQYLLPYLERAGANAWTVRERDRTTTEITATVTSPGYQQTAGWLNGTGPITQTKNSSLRFPWRLAPVSTTPTITATWNFTPAATGRQVVYVWYPQAANGAPDAHYRVTHAGGVTEKIINQTGHGLTWYALGEFPFYAGQPASVSLNNQSSVAGRFVAGGAIRVGGGIGSEAGDFPPQYPSMPSGRPRWEESSRYFSKYQGAPPSVYDALAYDDDDDVRGRPLYAEWERVAAEDSLFVSWHTNGSLNHTARGTQSFIYDGSRCDIGLCQATQGSDLLQYFIHRELVDGIREDWDAEWEDDGMLAANFGELRLLRTMPGVLLEIAYHDDATDTQALLDPRFADLTARATYRGIVRYFAYRDNVAPVFLPEPPAGFSVRNSAAGQMTVSWAPPPTDGAGPLGDPATGYRVYTSADGFGWDNGRDATTTSLTLNNLTPGQLVFVKVAALNAGGESLPTGTLAARASSAGKAPLLVVDAYNRNDSTNLPLQDDGVESGLPPYELQPSVRLYRERTNRHDYIIQHSAVITRPFDSASRSLLSDGELLTGYRAIDWMAGEESSYEVPKPNGERGTALTAAEQGLLGQFMNSGGALLISGSEIGRDLVFADLGPVFYESVLKSYYQGSNPWQFDSPPYPNLIRSQANGLFSGLADFTYDDGTQGTYHADMMDFFFPLPEDRRARSAFFYAGGAGQAGMTWDSGTCSKLVYFAFPFETIVEAAARQKIMNRSLDFLLECGNREQQNIYAPFLTK